MVRYEYDILIGIILGAIILLIILATIIEKFFPKSKIPKFIDKIAGWIRDNLKI